MCNSPARHRENKMHSMDIMQHTVDVGFKIWVKSETSLR